MSWMETYRKKKKKVELWRRAGPCYWDFMCLDFVPRTRQDFPFGLLLPCPREAPHTRLSYSKRHFPDGSHFHSYHIWGRKYWGRQLLSDRIARDTPLPVTPMKEHSRPALSLNHCIARSWINHQQSLRAIMLQEAELKIVWDGKVCPEIWIY